MADEGEAAVAAFKGLDENRETIMAKSKDHRWKITRIRGNRAELLGVVTAATEAAAIKRAIEDLQITDPEKQRRLVASHILMMKTEPQD